MTGTLGHQPDRVSVGGKWVSRGRPKWIWPDDVPELNCAVDPAVYDAWVLAPRYGLRPNPVHMAALELYAAFVSRCDYERAA